MKQTDIGIFCIHEKEKGICLFESAQVRRQVFSYLQDVFLSIIITICFALALKLEVKFYKTRISSVIFVDIL